jgi:SAM-dependent methyltransferase
MGPAASSSSKPQADYSARIAAEQNIYTNCLDVHALPEIFHYWSNRHVRPKAEAFGFSSPNGLFDKYLEIQCRKISNRACRFVSIGAGNCYAEIAAAATLRKKGLQNFVLDCLDLNPTMLERGRLAAEEQGVADNVHLLQGDFNDWQPTQDYDAIIANQSLHHVTNLEGLFNTIRRSLKPSGVFLTSDMIGRNGHLRWPEALEIVHEFWRELPEKYRYNQCLRRYEELYDDWDCSTEGFEGIRAQDILPLLVENFHFQLFLGFGNAIDIFVDRPFGHNFNATAAWDRDFIDRVHERDELEMARGRVKPTHILAVMNTMPVGRPSVLGPLTPRFCVRRP